MNPLLRRLLSANPEDAELHEGLDLGPLLDAAVPPAAAPPSDLRARLLRSASPAASSAPLAPDIEAAHAAACAAGRDTYIDRVSGYSVFTRASHLARGACCGLSTSGRCGLRPRAGHHLRRATGNSARGPCRPGLRRSRP